MKNTCFFENAFSSDFSYFFYFLSYKDNNITSILSEGEQLEKLKTELVTKIMKYTKKKKLEAKSRVGNTKSMLAMLTDSNIPIDQ